MSMYGKNHYNIVISPQLIKIKDKNFFQIFNNKQLWSVGEEFNTQKLEKRLDGGKPICFKEV